MRIGIALTLEIALTSMDFFTIRQRRRFPIRSIGGDALRPGTRRPLPGHRRRGGSRVAGHPDPAADDHRPQVRRAADDPADLRALRRRVHDRRLEGRLRRPARLVPEPLREPRGRGAGQGRRFKARARTASPRRSRRSGRRWSPSGPTTTTTSRRPNARSRSSCWSARSARLPPPPPGPPQRLVERLGLDPERLGPGGVGDDGRRRQALDQRPGDLGVDRSDQSQPERREPGRDQRNRELAARRLPSAIAIRSSISA